MSKAKDLTLANRIRSMKPGSRLALADKKEREAACRTIKALRDAGIITGEIITRRDEASQKGYVVIAL